MPTIKIDVKHVTRIEGHGNIAVEFEDGRVAKCRWEVSEAPRFFEAMLVGRQWDEVTPIVSRICGICSVAHSLVSLKAIEIAFGVEPSEQTITLRKLLKHGEQFQSHVLHVGYLVLPDLLGVGSVFEIPSEHKVALRVVVELHRLANDICSVVGGRTTHPVRARVGGFSALPGEAELTSIRGRLASSLDGLEAVAELFGSVTDRIPVFERESEYIALGSGEEYALYDGDIISSDTGPHPVKDYLSVAREYVVPWSTAKWVRHNRDSYMVGALARFNLNGAMLSPAARRVAEKFGLDAPCHNPFLIGAAQLVECVHSVEESIKLIDRLLHAGIELEERAVTVNEGRGVAALEAPRGILFHDYTFDGAGRCRKANCIIPTNQNHANIQGDFDKIAPTLVGQPEEKIRRTLEMLVRAYDPCVSCSTH